MKKILKTTVKVVTFPLKVVLYPIGIIGIFAFSALRSKKKRSGDAPI